MTGSNWVNQTTFLRMLNQLDIAWLAGLLDGEGCIAFARRTDYNPHRLLQVRYDVKLAMADRATIERAHSMIVGIIDEDDVTSPFEERRKIKRRRQSKHYQPTPYDRRLAELATALRHGCGEARLEAQELLEQVIPSQAIQGSLFHKESRMEGVETSGLSPNNNDRHECPASDSPDARDEEIVQSESKDSSDGINSHRLH